MPEQRWSLRRSALVAAFIALILALGLTVMRFGQAPSPGGAPPEPPPPPPFESPPSEVVVACVGTNALVGYEIDGTGLIINPTAPSRVIGGALNPGTWAGVRSPFGLAIDGGGRMFVSNLGDAGTPPSITEFENTANGPTPSYLTYAGVTSQLVKPQGLALRRTPRSLMAANWIDPPVAGRQSEVFELAVSNATSAPTGSIRGPAPGFAGPAGVAIDAAQNVIITDAIQNAVFVFTPQPGATFTGAPVRTITGPATLLDRPISVAVDGQGTIYVVNLRNDDSQYGYVSVYAPSATGDVAPVRVLGVPFGAGPVPVLTRPFGIAVHSLDQTIYVTQHNELLVFPATASGNATPTQQVTDPKLNYVTAVAVRGP
jgi:hypothetical protein